MQCCLSINFPYFKEVMKNKKRSTYSLILYKAFLTTHTCWSPTDIYEGIVLMRF